MILDKELLLNNAKNFNIEIDDSTFNKLDKYAEMLIERNKQVNLTAITDSEGVTVKHFADSLSIVSRETIPENAKLADVGTGAGFPGMVLLIARPDLDITFIDSTNKKLDFIRDVLAELDLTANVVHIRAEEAGKDGKFREKFDVVTARAVSDMTNLSEYCLPLVKEKGLFIAMKGANAESELCGAKIAIQTLGGTISGVKSFKLSDESTRNIVFVKKISQTPSKYPRPSAQIAKKPLK